MVHILPNSKQKLLKLWQHHYGQETFQETFSVDNMKETRLYGYVFDFSVDYDVIAVINILDIQKYLMKNNAIV